MVWRTVAIVVFLDKDKNIVVQDRRGASKLGERYGFWGGQLNEGETPMQAIKRELKEELGYVPKKLDYWKKFSYTVREDSKHKGKMIDFHVFLSPITSELENAKVAEGKGMLKMNIDQVIKGEKFPEGSTNFLRYLKTDR
jgi:mutator protein MutT